MKSFDFILLIQRVCKLPLNKEKIKLLADVTDLKRSFFERARKNLDAITLRRNG